MMKDLFHLRSLDLTLLSLQETRILLLKLVLVGYRRDYWTFTYLQEMLNNLTSEECSALYSLVNRWANVIKECTNKSSEVFVYCKEAMQSEDNTVYKEVPKKPIILFNTIMRTLEKIRVRGDLSNDKLSLHFGQIYQIC